MLYLGAHLSVSKGMYAAGRQAVDIGANTFAFFTRNPRGAGAKALDTEDYARLRELLQEHRFGPLVAHAPYTMNPCSANPQLRELATTMLAEDLERLELLPGTFYNFHPGSHTGQGAEAGIAFIAEMLNRVLKPEQSTVVLLETMAGKGSEIGRSFEELRAIIDRVEVKDRIGVCFDSCHLFDGGYDVAKDFDGVLREFDRVVGLDKLRAMHINDSMNPFGSHKDRHARIGEGSIGLEGIVGILSHPVMKGIPFVLETPNEPEGYGEEIALLRGQCGIG
ncbi:deoxyribonuclease IV [Ruminococcaceae bacterium OttesenSCG-928-L11]|nr:deoxyribonuclease IV [Ruminococcaceae bacterium OttesenSCG-928-L11]